MDDRLRDNDWLAGDSFSLADITWIPQLVILKAAKYPFENYPHLEKWKNSIFSVRALSKRYCLVAEKDKRIKNR